MAELTHAPQTTANVHLIAAGQQLVSTAFDTGFSRSSLCLRSLLDVWRASIKQLNAAGECIFSRCSSVDRYRVPLQPLQPYL